MALTLQQARKAPNRKVRAHTKSRRGCGNCKLRKVKCDESRPNCKKCTTFGVVCDYDGIQPDLQLAVTGRGTMEIQQEFSSSPIPIVRMMLDTSLGRRSDSNPAMKTFYELKAQDLKLLSRFRGRTALTVSADKVLYFYQNEMMSLAWSHPYLMHAVLTLTLMHDRHLSAIPNKSMSTAEAFHWYQATALFNSRVSTRVLSSERAALWTTAAMLGAMTFSDIEAMTPEEAWPLRSPSFADLDWLRMSTGKNEFKISQASDTAEDQARDAQRTVRIQRNTLARQELDGLPQNFAQVFGLDAASTEDNNPYHTAATGFAQIINAQDTKTVILSFLYFVSEMRPDFKILLQLKDPRALLILAYWYAKVYRTVWWIERRASLEGRAICIYLERYFQHEKNIQLLLRFPKSILFTSAV